MASQATSSNAPAIQGEATTDLLIPKDCMQFGEQIPTRDLDYFYDTASIIQGCTVLVRVVYMYSPSHMWIHRSGDQLIELERITGAMDKYYREDGRTRFLHPRATRVGLYCSGCLHSEWYRLKIVKIHEFHIKVLLVDYGKVVTVSMCTLRPLLSDWGRLPQQAVRVRLGGIKPKNARKVWNMEVVAKVWRLLDNKLVWARFLDMDKANGVFRVMLAYRDPITLRGRYLHAQLKDLGAVDRDTFYAPKPRSYELDPDFDALENGSFYSYEELYVLKRFNIDAENITYFPWFSFHVHWMGLCKADLWKQPRVGITLDSIRRFWDTVDASIASDFQLKEKGSGVINNKERVPRGA